MTAPGVSELLIVEDNPHDLELTLRALTKCSLGHNVQVVKDGEEALEFLFSLGRYAERPSNPMPKVIFLDLKLPKVDGIEVLRQIKSHQRTQAIPVVMLTSSQLERDVSESYHWGANSYVVKPVEFSKLSDCIAHLSQYWLRLNLPPR